MCIIVHKPANVDMPTQDIWENCWNENPDGAGVMYRDIDGKVHIEKGFMKLKSFRRAIKRIGESVDLKSVEFVAHFRFATHGVVSPACCHPFPITRYVSDLRKTTIPDAHAALVHNGIISAFSAVHTTNSSDTMLFVKVLAGIDLADEHVVETLLKDNGKFVILTDGEWYRYGNFIEDNGVFYSNYGYAYHARAVYTGGSYATTPATSTQTNIIDTTDYAKRGMIYDVTTDAWYPTSYFDDDDDEYLRVLNAAAKRASCGEDFDYYYNCADIPMKDRWQFIQDIDGLWIRNPGAELFAEDDRRRDARKHKRSTKREKKQKPLLDETIDECKGADPEYEFRHRIPVEDDDIAAKKRAADADATVPRVSADDNDVVFVAERGNERITTNDIDQLAKLVGMKIPGLSPEQAHVFATIARRYGWRVKVVGNPEGAA